jgi:cytochrome c556
MKRSGLVAVVVVALGMGAGAAFAQQKPEVQVKQRQAVMTLQGKYFGPMAGMAQGKVPFNADVVKRNSAFLDNLSRMAWDGFDPNTKDVKSATLPVAYTDQAKFKDAAARLENEAHKLWEVAQRGDEGAIKAQIGAVGKACGACHNDFRQKQ